MGSTENLPKLLFRGAVRTLRIACSHYHRAILKFCICIIDRGTFLDLLQKLTFSKSFHGENLTLSQPFGTGDIMFMEIPKVFPLWLENTLFNRLRPCYIEPKSSGTHV